MRRSLLILLVALALAGCGDRAKDLYETGQLEERQFNEKSAARLYAEVLEKYPGSTYAPLARERLEALNSGGKAE